ncbi:MAG: hypothetical protein RLY87_2103 [Chloroflexota bacterium]|jgi:hypothetical protein
MHTIGRFLGSVLRTIGIIVVIGAAYLWIMSTRWGANLPQVTLAGSATITPLPVTATAAPSATQTVTATATATLVPTITATPTATPYVVTQDAIVRSMRNEWQLTTQSMIVDSDWHIDTRTNRSAWDKFFKGTLVVDAVLTYEIRAGIDLQNVEIVVAPGNKITITLPAPTIVSVSEDADVRSIKPKKDGVPYLLSSDDELDVALTKQISSDTAKTARTKACQRGILTQAAKQAVFVVKDLVTAIHPLIRYQDITVVTTPAVCR